MGFIKNAINKLTENNVNRCVKISVQPDEKFCVEFFKDGYWQISITPIMLDKSFDNDGTLNSDKLLRHIVYGIMKKFHVDNFDKNGEAVQLVDLSNFKWRHSNTAHKFSTTIAAINSHFEHKIIFLNGEKQSGKTSAIYQFCNELSNREKIFWLDFNGGNIDFSKILCEIINVPQDQDIYIILDNLECCGLDLAQNTFNLFSSFVNLVQGTNIQLIVVQDNNSKVYTEADHAIIELSKDSVSYELTKKETTGNTKNTSLPLTLNDTNSINDKIVKGYFIDLDNIKTDEERRLLFKLLVLSSYGINVQLNDSEFATAKCLLGKVNNLKLYRNRTAQCGGSDNYNLINFIKEHWNEYNFYRAYPEQSASTVQEDIIRSYYNNNHLTLNDINSVLQANTYLYNQNQNIGDNMGAYFELVGMAKQFEEYLINAIEKDFKAQNGEVYFENHLGAILFAAEALTYYSDEWKALNAWKRLAKLVRETYYIDGQGLPEIKTSKRSQEKTFIDFKNDENKNSIINQIILQDKVLEKFGSTLTQADLPETLSQALDEKNFHYFLTPEQQRENEKNIDINKFYSTYLLALLFEFEATAPESQRDEARIKKLFAKIAACIEYEDDYGYCYPARVPWVTARMLLAICSYKVRDPNIAKFKDKLSRWLKKCCYTFNVNGTSYSIWAPGTGLWNGILETTMTCTVALKKAGHHHDNYYNNGCNYIKHHKPIWLKDKSIADGILAYDTISLNDTRDSDVALQNAFEIYDELRSFNNLLIDKFNKNDRSLGNTHIANTFISLVNGLSIANPDIFLLDFKPNRNINELNKIFISFKTEGGKELSEEIYDRLAKNDKCYPYNYIERMQAGNWRAQLRNAIRQSDSFILIISDGVLSSKAVLEEIKIRIDANGGILPIIKKGCSLPSQTEIEQAAKETLNTAQTNKLKDYLNPDKFNIIDMNISTSDYSQKLYQYLSIPFGRP